jgi:internalin A
MEAARRRLVTTKGVKDGGCGCGDHGQDSHDHGSEGFKPLATVIAIPTASELHFSFSAPNFLPHLSHSIWKLPAPHPHPMSDLARRLIADNLAQHQRGEDATYLDLGRCGLTDETFPAEIGQLQHLKTLVLADEWVDKKRRQKSTNLGPSNSLGIIPPTLPQLSQLQSLNLSFTQVSDLSPLQDLNNLQSLYLFDTQVSDLSPLQALTNLQSLNLSDTKVSDLSPLQDLNNLQSLNLVRTQVSDLSPLQALTNLQSLNLSFTQVSDLSPLQGLTNLKDLNLSFTQVSDLRPLQDLTNLQSLDLRDTQVSNLSPLQDLSHLIDLDLARSHIAHLPAWVMALPRLRRLNLHGTSIGHLPYEIIHQGDLLNSNCYPDLRHWYDDLAIEAVRNEDIKVILIGNGRVGKSCVLDALTGLRYEAGKDSTHAIQLRTHATQLRSSAGEEAPCTLNYWDFGGQDIYHGTHRIFMQSRALFLLIWDWESESSPHRAAEEVAGQGYFHQNHPLPHWLDYIQSFSKESPVIVVQNKVDQDRKTTLRPAEQALIEETAQVHDVHRVSAKSGRGMEGLQEIMAEAIEAMPEWQLEMPASWQRTRQAVRQLAQEKADISWEAFEALCAQTEVRPVSRPSLLRYLHDTGVLFHQEDLFHGRIILDQQWVIEAVYTLFDRKRMFWRLLNRGNGQFSFEDLHTFWSSEKDFTAEQSQLALSFMCSCEICYQLEEDRENPREEALYVAPQLLPETLPEKHRRLWPIGGLFLRFRYPYLHQVFIQRFIVRAGKLADPEHVWRRGLWFFWQETHALIQAQPHPEEASGYIQMQTSGSQASHLLQLIREEFDRIHPQHLQYTGLASLEGQAWVEWEALKAARDKGLTELLAENGEIVDPQAFAAFFAEAGRKEGTPQGVQELVPSSLPSLSAAKIDQWKQMVTEGRLSEVIDQSRPYGTRNDLLQLAYQLTDLKQRTRQGLLSEDNRSLQSNRIVSSILGYLDQLNVDHFAG